MNRRVSTLLLLVVVAMIAGAVWMAFRRGDHVVVVYVSEDQVFSEPILKDFERDTGTRVKALYDTEEPKVRGAFDHR